MDKLGCSLVRATISQGTIPSKAFKTSTKVSLRRKSELVSKLDQTKLTNWCKLSWKLVLFDEILATLQRKWS